MKLPYVIVYDCADGVRFWTGSAWQSEYPDAASYQTAGDAQEITRFVSRVEAKWTRIVANYGTDVEKTVFRNPK